MEIYITKHFLSKVRNLDNFFPKVNLLINLLFTP
jgi:hypothetical protein